MRDLTDKEKKALPAVEHLSDTQLVSLYDKFGIPYDNTMLREDANKYFIITISEWVGGFSK